jgi:fibronectin-binding autotransporter adhesin
MQYRQNWRWCAGKKMLKSLQYHLFRTRQFSADICQNSNPEPEIMNTETILTKSKIACLFLLLGAMGAGAQTIYQWNTTTTPSSWATPGNWTPNGTPGILDTADFSQLDITAATTVTLDGSQLINHMIFGDTVTNTAFGWVVSAGTPTTSTLTVAGTNPMITVNALGGSSIANITAPILATNLTIAGPGTFEIGSLSSVISGMIITNGATVTTPSGGSPNWGPLTFTGNGTYNSGLSASYTTSFSAITNSAGCTNSISTGGRMYLGNSAGGAAIGGNLTLYVPAQVSSPSRVYMYGTWTGSGTLNIVGTSANSYIAPYFNGGGFYTPTGPSTIAYNFSSSSAGVNKIYVNGHDYSSGDTFNMGALSGTSDAILTSDGTGQGTKYTVGALNTSTTFAGQFLGDCSLIKTGTGTLTLSGNNTNNNAANAVNVNAGGVVGATGGSFITPVFNVAGSASFGVQVASAGGQWTGTNMIFQSGSALVFNFGGAPASAATAPLNVLGNLTLNNSVGVTVEGGNIAPGTYPLIQYGALAGNGFGALSTAVVTVPAGLGVALSNSTANSTVYMIVSNAVPSIAWATNSQTWDIATSTNWVNYQGSNVVYQQYSSSIGDPVLFGDYVSPASITVTLNTNVAPGGVLFSNLANTYTLSGSGQISGATAVTVSGTNSVTIATTNSYTGGTIINNNGYLQLTGAGNLGTGQVTLNGGTLYENVDTIGNTISNTAATSTLTFYNAGGGYYPIVTVVGGGTLNLNITGAGTFTPGGTMTGFGGTINVNGAIRTSTVKAATTYGSANANWNLGSTGSIGNEYGSQTVYLGALNGSAGSALAGGYAANGLAATIYVVGNLNTTSTFGGAINDGTADYTGLTKVGTGVLILTGANNYSDPTIVSNGTLEVDGSMGDYTATTNYAGATLAGTGTFYGPVDMEPGSTLAPGAAGSGNYGTLNLSDDGSTPGNGLSMNGCTNLFDISSSSSDLVNVSGGLSLAGGGTIKLNISGALPNGTYPLINYSSIASGSVANLTLTPTSVGSQSLSLIDSGSSIELKVSTAGNASLIWLPVPPGANGYWDSSSLNWTNSIAHDIEAFVDGDTVTFNDSGAANSPVDLQLGVAPKGVVVNSSANYTFKTSNNLGQITGAVTNGLTKSGTGTLTILTKNNFTGPTIINGGVVQVGDGSTLNTMLSSGSVTNNALLVFNQPDNSAVAGDLTGTGSLVKQGAGTLTVNGNATFTGTNLIDTGTLQFGSGGTTAIPTNQFVLADAGTLALDRSGIWTVTNGIVGNGSVVFSGPATNYFGGVNTYINNTYVESGVVRLTGPAVIPSGGATTGWLILDGGAAAAGTLGLNGFDQTVNALSGLSSTVLGRILNDGGTGTNTLTINTLANNNASYAGLILDNSGTGGKVALVVEGTGTNTLSGANTYSGGTTVNYPATLGMGSYNSFGSGMITLMGGTLSSTTAFARSSADPNSLTVPSGTNGRVVMSATMRLPALYGSGTLNLYVNSTGVSSTAPGDSFSACANFSGTVNIYGAVSGAQMTCYHNGGSFDGQLQNATVNLAAGTGGGVSLMGINNSGGNTAQFGALNADSSSSLGGAAFAGSQTYQIGALNTTSDIEGNIVNGTGGPSVIIKVGTGKLILNGSDTYTGSTTINGGSVVVGGSSFMASSPTITLAANTVLDVSAVGTTYLGNSVPQTLSGSGAMAGNVSAASSVINPGGSGTVGTLTFSNNLAMTGNVTNNFDIPASGAYDQIVVAGAFNASGTSYININALNGTIPAGTYTLISFGSTTLPTGDVSSYFTLGGSIVGQIRNLSLINSGTAIQLVVGAGNSLTWAGDGSANQWNLTNSPDWSGPSVFYQDDSVTFNDTSSNQTVNVTGTLAPAAITVASSSNYVFTSTGKLTATAGITKSGTGTLTIANTGGNDYSGAVNITGGILKAGVATALGSTNGATTISGTGALDVGGFNLGAEPVTVSGSGSGGGAILNSGASVQNALQYVTLAGDTTFGGPSRWDIRANTNGYLAGNNHNLTKTGTNDIYLVGLGNTALTNILIAQGRIGVQDSTMLGTNGTLTLFPGAGLDFWLTTMTNTKSISLTNATISSSDGTNVYGGPINLNGSGFFTATTPFILNGVLNGAGGLVQNGAGTLMLANAETYTGNTVISNGVLALAGTASIASSTNVDVTAGAVLNVSGLSGGLLTLSATSAQTLKGNGTVNGNVTAPAGTTVAPGENAIGTLTVTNTITLAGSTVMEINRDGAPTCDEIVAATNNYGGTLTVTNLNPGDPLVSGDFFKLFKGAYNGTFAAVNLPALTAGLTWNNTLSVDGTITVATGSSVNTNPTNITAVVSSGMLQLSWPQDHTGWRLLVQTNNLNKGVSGNTNDWATVAGSTTTNMVDITIVKTNLNEYYRMAYP